VVKNQDIVIIVERFGDQYATLQEQEEYFENHYNNSKVSIAVKTFVVTNDHHAKTEVITEMIKVMTQPRLVVYNRNLLDGSKHLLRLFYNHTPIRNAYGKPITKTWLKTKLDYIENRLKKKAIIQKAQPPKTKETKGSITATDRFGFPVISQFEKKGLIDLAANKRMQKRIRERNRRRKMRIFEISKNVKKLECQHKVFRKPVYRNFYEIVTWFAPLEKLMADRDTLKAAIKFYMKSTKANRILNTSLMAEKVLLYNCPAVPKKVSPEIKSIIKSDNEKKYARSTKRSFKKV